MLRQDAFDVSLAAIHRGCGWKTAESESWLMFDLAAIAIAVGCFAFAFALLYVLGRV
jgi:hypothetical protein